MPALDEALAELVRDATACATLESLACGKGMPKAAQRRPRRRAPVVARASKAPPFDPHERVQEVVQACREERKRRLAIDPLEDVSDARVSKLARFTDGAALAPYAPFLHFVPRLVNIVRPYQPRGYRIGRYRNDHSIMHSIMHSNSTVIANNTQSSLPIPPCAQVTLAEAVPMPGSGLTPGQPLDLAKIAAKCNGAYFAPKRFAAVRARLSPRTCPALSSLVQHCPALSSIVQLSPLVPVTGPTGVHQPALPDSCLSSAHATEPAMTSGKATD